MTIASAQLLGQFPQWIGRLKNEGFIHLPGHFKPEALVAMEAECALLVQTEYHLQNLASHSVYKSDSGDNRESHAMMLNSKPGEWPSISISPNTALGSTVTFHNQILKNLLGCEVSDKARVLMNWQRYFGKSKPVTEHFDGEYIKFKTHADGTFNLIEGVLPRLVFLVTVSNENSDEPQGTELIEVATKKRISPSSRPGDLLIFDNIRFRHWVPSLEHPRSLIGFRSFDVAPLHYCKERTLQLKGENYFEREDGFFTEGQSALNRLGEFYKNEWSVLWAATQSDAALF